MLFFYSIFVILTKHNCSNQIVKQELHIFTYIRVQYESAYI